MNYFFCFRIKIDEAHRTDAAHELVVDQLFRAIEKFSRASKVKEVVAGGSIYFEVFLDGEQVEEFRACAPMTYCIEVMPEF
jgi:hypothetical protein